MRHVLPLLICSTLMMTLPGASAAPAAPTAGPVAHGEPLQGDCDRGGQAPRHHRDNDGRPMHGDGGCR